MKPLDATLRAASAVAALALSGVLSGCYYYAPYGYYPGYGYYPAYPAVPTAATQQEMPVGPGDPAQTQFTMPGDNASYPAAPGYDTTVAYAAAPAYYPVAYPVYPYGYPYYGWPGWWGPSISLSFGYWGGCCGGHYGYWGHRGYWGGHGYWGHGHGYYGGGHGGWGGGHGGWGGGHGGWGRRQCMGRRGPRALALSNPNRIESGRRWR